MVSQRKTTGALLPQLVPISFPPPGDAVYTALYNAFWDALHQDWKSSYRRDPPPVQQRSWRTGCCGGGGAGRVHTLPAAEPGGRDASGLDARDHFTMVLGASQRTKQLVDTWNELAHRATTMPEDLYVIVANLLDFNAEAVMEAAEGRGERMRAMVLSFEELPVALFWNSAGRRWGGGGRNGWVPVETSKSLLTARPVMEVREEGLRLDLGAGLQDGEEVTEVLLLEGGVDGEHDVIRILDPRTNSMHELTLFRQDSCEASDGTQAVALVLERSLMSSSASQRPPVVRGALFYRVTSTENQDACTDGAPVLHLVYCCPLEASRIAHDDCTQHEPVIHTVAPISPATSITVQYGKYTAFPLFPINFSNPPVLTQTLSQHHPSLAA